MNRLLGLAIGVVFAGPAGFVVWRTLRLGSDLGDVLGEVPGPLWRTIQLSVLVAATTAILGTGLAWLTTRTDLPLRRFWRIALVLPLVLPSFVGAAAFIAGLAPGGVIFDAFEAVGLTPPRRFRGLGASWLVLTAFTYPYVLLPVSARLIGLRSSLEESGRLLGLTSTATFFRVVLPQLRSAILGGGLLVFLYTLSEFGAVQLLGFDTLTRVIYATRQTNRALSFASAAVLLVLAIAVVSLERSQRGRATPDDRASSMTVRPVRLGWRATPALAACVLVLGIGLIVPLLSLGTWARRGLIAGRVDLADLVDPAINTATVSVIAAVLAVVIVLPIALASTRRPHRLSDLAAVSVVGGFAIPGLVIALALGGTDAQHAGAQQPVPDECVARLRVRHPLREPGAGEQRGCSARRAERAARVESTAGTESGAPGPACRRAADATRTGRRWRARDAVDVEGAPGDTAALADRVHDVVHRDLGVVRGGVLRGRRARLTRAPGAVGIADVVPRPAPQRRTPELTAHPPVGSARSDLVA